MPHPKNDTQRIVVIGASTGGFEAFKSIIRDLPPDIYASIFIVWHMSPNIRGVLPSVLSKLNLIETAHAIDQEEIKPNRIYIAPPDYHMLIEEGYIRITHGPKENRFRPAIDPLFRSAAYNYGNRVVGIILSGALDDGTAGLWKIKDNSGIAIVQDPIDAEVSSMPANALQEVNVDYCVPVSEIAALITQLSQEKLPQQVLVMKDDHTKTEIDISGENTELGLKLMALNELSPFTCPVCHGVLTKIVEGNRARFRCHTGHAFSVDTLLSALTEKIEDSLYNAIRGIDESILLLNHIGDHMAEINSPKLAALYFKKSKDAELRADIIRKTVLSHEQLSTENISNQAEEEGEPQT